jgi:hypothetical protein
MSTGKRVGANARFTGEGCLSRAPSAGMRGWNAQEDSEAALFSAYVFLKLVPGRSSVGVSQLMGSL